MTFLSPLTLLWFIPAAIFVIILYLLKIKRRDVKVPAVFLWPPLTSDVRANSLFQKLRPNILLLLQLLFLLALFVALAKPVWKTNRLLGQATVIVIDCSASMKATDVSPSRFESARNRISALIKSMTANDEIAIISAGTTPITSASLTSDKKRLQDAVAKLTPADAISDVAAALRLAAAIVGDKQSARIMLLSDGAFPEVKDFSSGKAEIIYESVGGSDNNVGIIAFNVNTDPDKREAYVGIKNYASKPMAGSLNYFADGVLTDAKAIDMKPMALEGITFPVKTGVKNLSVSIEINDALASDNSAFLAGIGDNPLKVLLIGKGNYFLEYALAMEPNVVLDKAEQVPDSELAETSAKPVYDVVIFDNAQPIAVKARNVMLINAYDSQSPVQPADEEAAPVIVSWKKDDPVMKYVDLTGVLIDKAKLATPAPWANVLAETNRGALIVSGERRGKKWLYIGWTLNESDFPLQPAFPIFIGNIINWFSKDRITSTAGINAKASTVISVPAKASGAYSLIASSGKVFPMEISDGYAVYSGLKETGLYKLNGDDEPTEVAINLLNAEESDIAPKKMIQLGNTEVAQANPKPALRSLWKYIALIGLALMAFEWWIYARRS